MTSREEKSACGCSLEWRDARPNGTCATCGGWLPGESSAPLTALWSDVKRGQEQFKRWQMEQRDGHA